MASDLPSPRLLKLFILAASLLSWQQISLWIKSSNQGEINKLKFESGLENSKRLALLNSKLKEIQYSCTGDLGMIPSGLRSSRAFIIHKYSLISFPSDSEALNSSILPKQDWSYPLYSPILTYMQQKTPVGHMPEHCHLPHPTSLSDDRHGVDVHRKQTVTPHHFSVRKGAKNVPMQLNVSHSSLA